MTDEKRNTPVLKFKTNIEETFTLRFDTPLEGQKTGRDGTAFTYHLYGITVPSGEEWSLFASNVLDYQLKQSKAKSGDVIKAIKEEFNDTAEDGSIQQKSRYRLISINGVAYTPVDSVENSDTGIQIPVIPSIPSEVQLTEIEQSTVTWFNDPKNLNAISTKCQDAKVDAIDFFYKVLNHNQPGIDSDRSESIYNKYCRNKNK